MKKTILIVAIAMVVLVALSLAGFAYAQSQTPPTPPTPGSEIYGPGMRGGNGARASGMMGGNGMMAGRGVRGAGMMGAYSTGNYGPIHEYMINALAERLDLTPEALQDRITAGETAWQIAQSQGLSDEEIRNLMLEAHDEALQAAVVAGVITQEQADWMDQHMEQMWTNGGGLGPCQGGATPGSGLGPRWRWNNTQPAQPTN